MDKRVKHAKVATKMKSTSHLTSQVPEPKFQQRMSIAAIKPSRGISPAPSSSSSSSINSPKVNIANNTNKAIKGGSFKKDLVFVYTCSTEGHESPIVNAPSKHKINLAKSNTMIDSKYDDITFSRSTGITNKKLNDEKSKSVAKIPLSASTRVPSTKKPNTQIILKGFAEDRNDFETSPFRGEFSTKSSAFSFLDIRRKHEEGNKDSETKHNTNTYSFKQFNSPKIDNDNYEILMPFNKSNDKRELSFSERNKLDMAPISSKSTMADLFSNTLNSGDASLTNQNNRSYEGENFEDSIIIEKRNKLKIPNLSLIQTSPYRCETIKPGTKETDKHSNFIKDTETSDNEGNNTKTLSKRSSGRDSLLSVTGKQNSGEKSFRNVMNKFKTISKKFGNYITSMQSPKCKCLKSEQLPCCERVLKWIKHCFKNNDFNYEQNKQLYENLLKTPIDENTETIQQIKRDLNRTFPGTKFLAENSEGILQLERVLTAYSLYDNQCGYVQGMNFIAASILYHASEEITFWLFVSLIESYELRDIYLPGLPGLFKHCQIIYFLLHDYLRKISHNFSEHGILVEMFASDWVIGLFSSVIPLESMGAFYDYFFEQGWMFFYKVCLCTLRTFENELASDEETHEILKQIKQQGRSPTTSSILSHVPFFGKKISSNFWDQQIESAKRFEFGEKEKSIKELLMSFDQNKISFNYTGLASKK